jgi:signal transduction histidine kinase
MINTVIRNLLTNSIKFTKDRGNISISTEKQNGNLLVSVKDDGIGMTQETIDSILSHSTIKSSDGTSGEKGTGLGLLLCKEFITKNNGELNIESEPGKGSTFSFTVPTTK